MRSSSSPLTNDKSHALGIVCILPPITPGVCIWVDSKLTSCRITHVEDGRVHSIWRKPWLLSFGRDTIRRPSANKVDNVVLQRERSLFVCRKSFPRKGSIAVVEGICQIIGMHGWGYRENVLENVRGNEVG